MSREFRLVAPSGVVILQTNNWQAMREAKSACQECCIEQLDSKGEWGHLSSNERIVLDVLWGN